MSSGKKIFCKYCFEDKVGPEHDISEHHIRNKILAQYAHTKEQNASNRKGVVVVCNVRSSFTSFLDYTDGNIKISAKPNEEVTFHFSVVNSNASNEILLIYVQITHTRLNFRMFDDSLAPGCVPRRIPPKMRYAKEIRVKFKSAHIGQYVTTIIFSMRKSTNESVIILRDLEVFVEERPKTHEEILSPYTLREVKADCVYKATNNRYTEDLFPIPHKHLKNIFACNLEPKDSASKDEKIKSGFVRNIFAVGVTRANYIHFFHHLLWYEETILRINIKKYNMSEVPLGQKEAYYTLEVPGLAEKRPSLIPGDTVFVKPRNSDLVMFEAIVEQLESESSILLAYFDADFAKYYSKTTKFDVRFLMSRLSFDRMHSAVDVVLTVGHGAKIFPTANILKPRIKRINKYYNRLVECNPDQRTAVENIVAGTSGTAPYLVHGPPGTGKTITIVEAVLQIY